MRRLACLLLTLAAVAACGRTELGDPNDPVPSSDVPEVIDGDASGEPDLPPLFDVPPPRDTPDVPQACRPTANCGPGRECCGSVCTDILSNAANCGGCGRVCGSGQVCAMGSCVERACMTRAECGAGQDCCDNRCVDVSSDPGNCGACGRSCGPGARCAGGVCMGTTCACPAGQSCCEGNRCVDTLNDPSNCGACGTVCGDGSMCVMGQCFQPLCADGDTCPGGRTCCGGLCVLFSSDRNNCGACRNACAPGEFCSSGRCQTIPTCGGGPACAPGSACCGARCVNTETDPSNCGACGNVCTAGQSCIAGRCGFTMGCGGLPTCGRPTVCCGDRCVATQSDPFNCGGCGVACRTGETCTNGACIAAGCGAGPACGPGQACCGGVCASTASDNTNCGGCGVVCGRGSACVAGRCVMGGGCGGGPACAPGSSCCGDRCSNLLVDNSNCGGCGVACAPGQTCTMGRCLTLMGCGGGPPCGPGGACCGASCVDVFNDPGNCGSCGNVCRLGQRCAMGMCFGGPTCGGGPACTAGSLCCNDRCVDVSADTANCGACGRACPAGFSCQGARCVMPQGCGGGPACATGQSCCAGACVDTRSDELNCGACGRACVQPPNTAVACANGACGTPACLPGFADCNGSLRDGCEANTQTDATNCGMCGNACPTGLACQAGRCGMPSTGSEGAFNPRVNPTFLTPGVHNFTTITVPANVVVYVAGGGADNALLDLRATGDVVIDGTIDVSGGPGAQSTITSRSTRQGRAGAGGFTGDPRTATPGPACEWVAGVSGGNGRGFPGSTGTCRVGSNTACITDNATQLMFASPAAQFGGGGGVFTGYRAYGAGGGGFAGGGPGALGRPYPGQDDCTGTTGGGGTAAGQGGTAGVALYNGRAGSLGQTQCPGIRPEIPAAWVGGGGGGSIGTAASQDLAVRNTFQPGSGGGGGSADYLNRPAFGGTSGGGGGGGALRIWSQTQITLNGRVLANGGAGGDAYIGTSGMAGCDPQPGAAGGGGSGGVIFLRAPAITTGPRATVSAVGGEGGVGSLYASGGAGGAGGIGRIRVSATTTRCTLNGSFNPPLVAGCAPTPGAGTAGRAYVANFPE